MNARLLTLFILVAAVALYVAGMSTGASALVCVGGALELWFWVRVMRKTVRRATTATSAQLPYAS